MKSLTVFLLSFLICIALLSGCKKDCENPCVEEKKNLELSSNQEVPTNNSVATGEISIQYDKCENLLKFTVTWNNLTGAPTGAHIHGVAARGVNASVKYDFSALIPKTTSGTYTHSVKVDGIAIVEESLLQGMYYINIHTATYPGGEIRGQLEF